MTATQKHILEIVKCADNLTATKMMDLHNQAMDRLREEHEADRQSWEAERHELHSRLNQAHVRNFDLARKNGSEKTKYFVFLFIATCCVLWALNKAGVVGK